jgi:7-carboxy-7-deazaguanine synthase
VEGEGPHVGYSTLFVRFARCDLRCNWCDTPQTWKAPQRCRFETGRGDQTFRELTNPVTVKTVLEAADALEVERHHFVSFTGGEPLLQPEAVRALALEFKERGPKIHLETHGAAPEGLAKVIDVIDVVSMDWKFSTDVKWAKDAAHGMDANLADLSEESLRIARKAPDLYVKAVLTPSTSEEELDDMCARIAAQDERTPVILQPVSAHGKVPESLDPQRLMAHLRRVEETLKVVRIIPQTHKTYGAL